MLKEETFGIKNERTKKDALCCLRSIYLSWPWDSEPSAETLEACYFLKIQLFVTLAKIWQQIGTPLSLFSRYIFLFKKNPVK